MKEFKGVKVGQIWEDLENGEPDFTVTAIEDGSAGEGLTMFITYEQDGKSETIPFLEFMDWAEINCFSPKGNHEGFWLKYFHMENK